MKKSQIGFSLPEVIIATLLLVIVFSGVLKGMEILKGTMHHQMKLSGATESAALSYEIAKAIRGAKKLVSVTHDSVEMEMYDFKSYPPMDKRALENPIRVRYIYISTPMPHIRHEIYPSLTATTPSTTKDYFRATKLIPPTLTKPYFTSSYSVGSSTVGVLINFRLQQPLRKSEEWIPVTSEANVYGTYGQG